MIEKVVNAVQMKEIDQYSIREKNIPAILLMERAALAVCEVIKQQFMKKNRLLIICSTGNNGADGLAVARILKLQGWDIAIYIVGNREKCTEEFTIQMSICEKIGVEECCKLECSEYDGIVDSIFGIGLSRNVTGEFADIIEKMNLAQKPIVAVDVPSGIHPSSGKVMGIAVRATYTVTFGYNKIGLLLYPGASYAGEVHVIKDVGFVLDKIDQMDCAFTCLKDKEKCYLPERMVYSNKGTYGHVLTIAGSKKMSGAAYLSAMAAYRMGTGLVKVLSDSANRDILMQLLPECIMDSYNNITKEEMHNAILWAKVVVVGPGLSIEKEAEQILNLCFENRQETIPFIVDADALNMISEKQQYGWLQNTIITPHLGEMARLTGKTIAQIQDNLIETAKEFAMKSSCICVLKDARTIVTDGKRVYINTTGNNGMATGGSGDVLTGIIAGLIAQGMNCFDAAWTGVYLHGLAGDLAAQNCGERYMVARDLLENLSEVIR